MMKTRSKGFTLIELLAVIVILAIIALIATPIILNVIDTAKKGSAESSALGYIDAVEKQIAINTLDSTKTDIADGVYTVAQLTTAGVNVKGQKPSDDSIVKVEKNQVVDYSLKIGDYVVDYDKTNKKAVADKNGTLKTELSGSTPSAPTKKYTIVNDVNSDGIADIGDEIQVNGENFYVIKNDGTNIDALAKYNLNVGSNAKGTATGIQDSEVLGWVSSSSGLTKYGNVAFSDNNGWPYANDDDINIQDYEGPVKTAINNYKAVVTNASAVRLITKTELEGLGCDSLNLTCSGAPAWVYSTSYWAGSADSSDANGVWYVVSYGDIYYGGRFNDGKDFGVRPVITLES